MLQLETQSTFEGFGNGKLPGEYFFSQYFLPTQFGLAPYYRSTGETLAETVTTPTRIKWFGEYASGIYGLDTSGRVLQKSTTWQTFHTSPGSSHGNGFIIDQKNRPLVIHDRYVAKYESSSWTDSWLDLGSSVTGDKGADTYLDWVVIPHGNNLAVLNITDDSFNSSGFTLPSGCEALTAKSNRTGILVAVNFGSRSFVFLWDAQSDRSTAPWIWFDNPIKTICRHGDGGWIVTTTRQLILTDGYTTRQLPDIPDSISTVTLYNPPLQGTFSSNGKFWLNHTDVGASTTRRKSGTWVLDVASELWTYIPPYLNYQSDVTMGTLFQDSTARIFSSETLPTAAQIYQISNNTPDQATFISAPFGATANRKVAEGIQAELVPNSLSSLMKGMSFTVTAKIANARRAIWGTATQNGTAPNASTLVVNGLSAGTALVEVGDEVTILSGQNSGKVRHITAIANQGTSSETWTLDSTLGSATESGAAIGVQPFKKVSSYTFSAIPELKENQLYFDVRNRVKGRKFLVKLHFEGIVNAPIALSSLSLIYNDLGIT